MKLNKLLLALCLLPSLISAQEYGLEVEVVSEDIGVLTGALGVIDLTGYACYRGLHHHGKRGRFPQFHLR